MSIEPARGEVWLVEMEPTRGAEMRKTRPAVVISEDHIGRLPLRIVVPFTGWSEEYELLPWLVRMDPDEGNGLSKVSAADVFQMRSVSIERMTKRLGKLSSGAPENIAAAVAVCVGYHPA
ncbi:MAG TPA: type II toxin-antitoxin system PemK/MazF family toxin [Armatimonadota bacterium]|nr:type II toxin-antitoxin system PemK/MazF family toxin [Armatimonadota bacterium]